jgi:hypothetical protein
MDLAGMAIPCESAFNILLQNCVERQAVYERVADWRTCLRVGTDAAWATDRGEPIVRAMLAYLRTNGVLLPAAAVLERIGLAARARARKKTFEAITA